MMKRNHMWVLLECALLIMAFFCPAQAVTTQDLLQAQNSQGQGLIPSSIAGAANQAPSAKSLTPDQEGPLTAGSTIIWTGYAYDPDGDKLLYQFWLNGPLTGNKWKPMTGWTENNTWNWTTSPVDSGVNIIDLRVRDGRHAAPWAYDSHISAEFDINDIAGIGSTKPNSKPTILSIRSNRQSPQDKGTKVTWTTKASDPDGDTILYRYFLKGASTEDQWVPVASWTTNNIWMWDTGQSKAGVYMIEVRIRDGYHADVESSDDYERVPYVVMLKGIIE
ncbi:MAG: hypothetical protein A4E48_01988 [Methanosaeta sp. PtaU1.Bin060]|nr:MAG: hypothetical protein A4E48_01988 [Methanosaeta sp. PtaU1.Bin060]